MSGCFIFLVTLLPPTSSSAMVHPVSGSFVKNVLKMVKWNVEITRDCHILKYFTHVGHQSTMRNILINLNLKWTLCRIRKVKFSKKQETRSRCSMVLMGWEQKKMGTFSANYVIRVPKEYGVNFTVTSFQTRYSG